MNPDNSKGHWDKAYSGEKVVFSLEPNKVVENSLAYISSGKVFDLGAGDGGDSLFLAEKGFDVTAVNISTSAIRKINDLAKERNLKIETIVGDISAMEVGIQSNLVLLIRVLQLFDKNESLGILKRVQNATVAGGINVLDVVIKDSDFYKFAQQNESQINRFYPTEEEIIELYRDWEVLFSKKAKWNATLKHWPDGKEMENESLEIIFRKIK